MYRANKIALTGDVDINPSGNGYRANMIVLTGDDNVVELLHIFEDEPERKLLMFCFCEVVLSLYIFLKKSARFFFQNCFQD